MFSRHQDEIPPGGHDALFVNGFAKRQPKFDPPSHILLIAKCTYHDHAGTESRINFRIGQHLNLMAEYGHLNFLTHIFIVSIIIRVHGNGYAGCQQFGSCSGHIQFTEMEIVQGGLPGIIFHFGKCDGCLAAGAPVHRMVCLVYPAAMVHLHKGVLGLAVVLWLHGDVLVTPVDAEGQPAHSIAHLLYVTGCQFFAQPPELCTRHLVFCNVVYFLHLDLGRQAVAVPALWKHYIISAHAFVPGNEIYVTPVKGIAYVEIACGVGRRRINNILGLIAVPVKVVH